MGHESGAVTRLGPLLALARAELVSVRGLIVTHPVAWPALLVRERWMSAVLSDEAVHFNLGFVGLATAVTSVIDLLFGSINATKPGDQRFYGLFVVALGLSELIGGLLLMRRSRVGRALVVLAACGYFVEAVLALARFDQSLFSLVVFVVIAPIEVWVIWFLCHPRSRALFSTRPRR
ncbi:MAG: hypothetical protein ACREQM_06720 [Candidatus Dormibacteraceae bacterium]